MRHLIILMFAMFRLKPIKVFVAGVVFFPVPLWLLVDFHRQEQMLARIFRGQRV